jgi:hypothetical protein
MTVARFDIVKKSDFGEGEFGDSGRYQQLDGKVTFHVDPSNSRNQRIIDLDKAPTTNSGMVEFSADFSLVTPVDATKGNGRLVVDIPNRGNKLTAGHFHQVVAATPEDRDNPGDGFLCHRGFSFLSIGWQWDVNFDGGMALHTPEALIDGEAIEGDVIMKLQADSDRPHLALVQPGQDHLPYPVYQPNTNLHRLYERQGTSRIEVDRAEWQFAQETAAGIEASANHVYLNKGFKKGVVHELVYRTRGAPVVGTGLLAIRDIATCLKYHDDISPLTFGFDQVYAFGVSQTGRVLRHFLYEGLNRDEQERIAYDGMLIHIAGGQRGDFNHRFALPGVVGTPGFGQAFPFAATPADDPYSDVRQGLFDRLDPDSIPRVFFSNTSWEYWRGDASLVHALQGQDIEEHPSTRTYHVAGTHHIGGLLINGKQISQLPTGLKTVRPLNVVTAAPVFRALFIALDRWVTSGHEPPSSRHPRLSDGSAITREEALARFSEEPDLSLDPTLLPAIRRMDFGPGAASGTTTQPVPEYETYTAYVSSLDDDLNETSGIHLPDIACPLGYHSGWNPRSPEIGASDQLATFAGFSVFFSHDEIRARYADEAGYLEQVKPCVESLVETGFVLSQDREWMINIARSRYRAAMDA